MTMGFAFVSTLAMATPVIDDSPTRVQTLLKVDMQPIGTLKPKSVGEISSTRWTLDCGGMDREHADWRAVREYVVPLGIARIRQQAGWARCEKDPGIYDFAWLDQCVFDAKKMGVDVWMELSYGNPGYKGGGGRQLAAGFPTSEEGLAAWDRWVERMAKRYKGTVKDWCIWNEPDLFGNNDCNVAADFAIRTAEIVKREIPDARIAAFAINWANAAFIEPFLKELNKRGKAHLFASLAYHHYSMNPDEGYADVEKCRRLIAELAPSLKMMEGEGGTQSEWCENGALSKYPWTELTQAKYVLRRSLGDLAHGNDTEVFHLCDLEYRTSGFHDGLVRYGLIKTTGQADGYRVLKVKTAYYAVQNAVSVFNDAFVCLDVKTTSKVAGLERPAVCDWRDLKTGTPVVVFWDASSKPIELTVTKPIELTVKAAPFAEPVWVDLLTGNAYAIVANRVRTVDDATVYSVPAYDSPVFVTDRGLLDLAKSWYVEWLAKQKAK